MHSVMLQEWARLVSTVVHLLSAHKELSLRRTAASSSLRAFSMTGALGAPGAFSPRAGTPSQARPADLFHSAVSQLALQRLS